MKYLSTFLIAVLIFACDDGDDGITVGEGNGNGGDTTKTETGFDTLVTFTGGPAGSPESYFNDATNIFVDSKNRVWIGTWDEGVLMYNQETQETVRFDTEEITGSDFGGTTRAFIEANDGTIFIGDGGGLCYFDEGSSQVRIHDSEYGELGIFSIAKSNDGTLYFGAFNGSVGVMDVAGTITKIELPEAGGAIRSIAFDGNGDLWMGGSFALCKYDGNNYTYYDTEAITGEPLGTNDEEMNVRSLAVDEMGNIWVGSQEGYHKTYYFNGQNFVLAHDFNVTGVTTRVNKHYFHDGDYWIASDNGGMIQVKADTVYREWTTSNSNIPDNDCYSLYFKDNRVYFGTNFFDNGGWGYKELD